MRPSLATRPSLRTLLLHVVALSALAGCASLGRHGGGAPAEDRDRVVTVRANDPDGTVVLTGSALAMRSGTFRRSGDSTVVRGTAVAELPAGAFRLQLRALPRDRVVVEFTTAHGSDGRPARVHAEGRGLALHRGEDGALMLDAESVDVRSWPVR